MRISLAQMDLSLGEPEHNFARAEEAIAEAGRRGSDLVVLPELWSTGCAWSQVAEQASPLAHSAADGGWMGRFAGLAQTHRLWLAGSMLEVCEGRYTNSLVLYNPQGNLCGVYRKIHLFRLMQEDQHLSGGDQLVVADMPWGRVGLAICYDLRFPEIFRRYALAGARLMILPAEWPNPRRAHWSTLLRARAIENQCFVAACNRVGESGNDVFFGASAIVDPWGETVVEGGAVEMLLTADVDLERVEEVRRRIRVFSDRREELYSTPVRTLPDAPSAGG